MTAISEFPIWFLIAASTIEVFREHLRIRRIVLAKHSDHRRIMRGLLLSSEPFLRFPRLASALASQAKRSSKELVALEVSGEMRWGTV